MHICCCTKYGNKAKTILIQLDIDLSYAVYPCSGILCKNPGGGSSRIKLFVHPLYVSVGLLPQFWKQGRQPHFFARLEDIGLLLHCFRSDEVVQFCS